jgi:hypothetical protein
LALGISASAADGLLADGLLLTSRLPQVLTAVEDGQIHERAAHVLANETIVLDDHDAAVVADAILARPALRTVPQIARATRTAVARIDPASAADREQRAVASRFVRPHKVVADGMVTWEGYLPIAESMAIWDRLCAVADATKVAGDPRGVDARRADAAVALLLGEPLPHLTTPDSPVSPGLAAGAEVGDGDTQRAHRRWRKVWRTDVVVAASTLLGDDEHPAHVPGWGTITAPTARRLASGAANGPAGGSTDGTASGPANGTANVTANGTAPDDQPSDAQWRRILTDPHSGLVSDYGTTRYRPPDSLADYVRARDGRCYEPLCQRSAWQGDLDHIRNSPIGPSPRPDPDGRTSAANLGSGCRRGHATKAAPGWAVEAPSEGRFTWTTPTKHTYVREPEPPIDWSNTYLAPDKTRGRGAEPSAAQDPADPDGDPPF